MPFETRDINGTITASILKTDIDTKAYYTVYGELPPFLVPLQYADNNKHINVIYATAGFEPIRACFGEYGANGYAGLWDMLLEPLTLCGDWFMNVNSFLFDVNCVYYDRANNRVRYLYVPSRQNKTDNGSLAKFVSAVADECRCTDPMLENAVLRAVRNFNLNNFISIIKPSVTGEFVPGSAPVPQLIAQPIPQPVSQPAPAYQPQPMQQPAFQPPPQQPKPLFVTPDFGLDETVLATTNPDIMNQTQSPVPQEQAPRRQTLLLFVGTKNFPPQIIINPNKDTFTIGRHDPASGVQNDFEFPSDTKAISRRHAAIERWNGAYYAVDMNAKIGTSVNGAKLAPAEKRLLNNGDRVTFGNDGAEYEFRM
jgi:hypothetical protein